MVTFTARRSEPVLVAPARPTPKEMKTLSDLDDQWTLRFYESIVGFFRARPGKSNQPGLGAGGDMAKGIKAALAGALVYYYPMGHGRPPAEAPRRKQAGVDCTGEGVVFVEAYADVRLEDLGQPLLPPYPCVEEFMGDAGDIRDVVDKPLLYLQVTQLKCGGFIIGLHVCHCIVDRFGILQFIKAIADFASGELIPTTLPVWKRDIFTARIPPSITHIYPAYKPFLSGLDCTGDDVILTTPEENMVEQHFLFGPKDTEFMRSHIPEHLAKSTTNFELLTAVMWRCRTLALGYESSHKVRVMFTLNKHGKRMSGDTMVPRGYNGNAHFSPMVEATVDELTRKPLTHILELMRKAKLETTEDCMKSMVDLLAFWREQPPFSMDRTYELSDTKWVGGNELKFGPAELIGGGTPLVGDLASKLISYHTSCKNENGEDSTVISLLMPKSAMKRFTKEIGVWVKKCEEKIIC